MQIARPTNRDTVKDITGKQLSFVNMLVMLNKENALFYNFSLSSVITLDRPCLRARVREDIFRQHEKIAASEIISLRGLPF